MEAGFSKQDALSLKWSVLLEYSASGDLINFKTAIEEEGLDIDQPGLWYGRRIGTRKMSIEERTPLMIASMFGNVNVLSYIIGSGLVDVNKSCGSDRTTALHCAVAGGSAAVYEVVKLLLDASADPNSVDAYGNRPCDLTSWSRIKRKDEVCKGLLDQESSPHPGEHLKKEYPVDHTLPDIKNGVYGTDEFRMFSFKIKPCSRAYSHDWTECPFVHPGENARRRDPRKYHYSCVPCPEFRKGLCRQGDSCEYSHGIFECWLHPAQYRTRLCKDETNCARRVCFFAHKIDELRPLYPSTGCALPVPSPRSMSSLGLGTPPLTPTRPSPTPPRPSPSSSSSPIGGNMWPNAAPPMLQLPSSRLKSGHANNLDDTIFSHLKSPTGMMQMRQTISHQLSAIYPNNNNNFSAASPIRSYEPTMLSSRAAAAFAKRSQSFIERNNPVATAPPHQSLSDWGSPDGKLDWAIRGDELNKLRKSASFGFSDGDGSVQLSHEEPDVSWVQSLVKDTSVEPDRYNFEEQQQQVHQQPQQQQYYLSRGGAEPAWAEQLYMEQEQLVA